jgi:hypothetical protein
LNHLVFSTLGPSYACAVRGVDKSDFEVHMRALHQARRDELAGTMSACCSASHGHHISLLPVCPALLCSLAL